MNNYRRAVLILCVVSFSPAASAQRDLRLEVEGRRRALVIGNNDYSKGRLTNAVNDARLMSDTLTKLNFQVTAVTDASLRQMETAVNRFASSLGPGDVAMFYYAGHGVQIDGENYLIPVDFRGTDPADVRYGARSASWVLDKIVQSGAVLQIVVLDACRTDPFRTTRALGGGLAQMQGARGSFIAFATAAGKVADDSPTASNGLFTSHLVQALNQPGLSLDEVFNRVRVEVDRVSAGQQLPYIYSGVVGEFYFTPRAGASAVTASPRPVTGAAPAAVTYEKAALPTALSPAAQTKDNAADGQRYSFIPPGTFTMGCVPGDVCPFIEKPAHQVTITKGFWIGQTPVTQQAYARVKGNNPSQTKELAVAVNNVSWSDAQSFCQAIGMRLPTEAEWEYAARAGTTGRVYADADQIAWLTSSGDNKAHPVSQKAPNAWGLYDLVGYMVEWVSDWYTDEYPSDPQQDPHGPPTGTQHLVRSVSRTARPEALRLSARGPRGLDIKAPAITFRCAGD